MNFKDEVNCVGVSDGKCRPVASGPQKTSMIKVIGVGGGGGNAVKQLVESGIVTGDEAVMGVELVVCNTDTQALNNSPVPIKIQLGERITEGLGAGNDPSVGEKAAVESLVKINEVLDDCTKMVIITAGMGGGTGTGAAPVVAKAAHEKGILTIAIVTVPFSSEGNLRINQANEGIKKMREYVDALLVINDDKLIEFQDCSFSNAFKKADEIVVVAAKSIAEIITSPGSINLDFRDVNSVMKNHGVALFGSAEAEGEGRAIKAIENALNSPLLHDNNISGAKDAILSITTPKGENELTMKEFGEITSFLRKVAGPGVNLIWGTSFDDSLGGKIRTTVVATGFGFEELPISATEDVKVVALGEPLPKADDISSEPVDLRQHGDFGYVKDLNKLNEDQYLDKLENETALERKKRMLNEKK
ncbi:MAG: cell division protein FtsZ [Bacteroidales bacterium]|nr:cell division protein FtsZ [Bacteroidales bacterium]